jgi:hypothetical protein
MPERVIRVMHRGDEHPPAEVWQPAGTSHLHFHQKAGPVSLVGARTMHNNKETSQSMLSGCMFSARLDLDSKSCKTSDGDVLTTSHLSR